jgi:hypothetical protein
MAVSFAAVFSLWQVQRYKGIGVKNQSRKKAPALPFFSNAFLGL